MIPEDNHPRAEIGPPLGEDHVNDFAIVTLEADKQVDHALTALQMWPV